jgi:hypothetical protein
MTGWREAAASIGCDRRATRNDAASLAGVSLTDCRLAIDRNPGHGLVMDRRAALSKTAQLLMVLFFSFYFGRLSTQYGDDALSWVGVVSNVILLGLLCYLLIRDFWKPSA